MDLLKREMERKKNAMAKAKASGSLGVAVTAHGGNRKYLKASDLRRLQEEEEEEQERKRKEEEMAALIGKQTKDTEEGMNQEGNGDKKRKKKKKNKKKSRKGREDEQDGVDDKDNDTRALKKARRSDSIQELSLQEIIGRLRDFGLPVRLFGETNQDRMDRLRRATEQLSSASKTQSEMDEFRLGRGHSIRNPFLDKQGGADDNDGLLSAAKSTKNKKDKSKKNDNDDADKSGKKKNNHDDNNDDGGDDNDNDDDDEGGNGKAKTNAATVQLDDSDLHKFIYKYFKGLLKAWEDELAARPDPVKRTAAGKNETKTLKQCKDYIRPLFKLCKTRTLEDGLLQHLVKIVRFCQAGEFVRAHDGYMDVAIGRAAWPIGVTMVGIHARTGRAKIESANVAHVMNSELQRKYLTSVKRLMSYAQKISDVAPSKKVMN